MNRGRIREMPDTLIYVLTVVGTSYYRGVGFPVFVLKIERKDLPLLSGGAVIGATWHDHATSTSR